MISRLFWIVLGAVAGVLLVRKITKAAEAYTPTGVARSVGELGEGLREVAAVIREGMAEREHELRVALGVEEGTLSQEAARSLRADPSH